jgi:hypothetical protein
VTAITIFQLLLGRRDALLTAARCRHSWWVGVLLVLSAGLARNYDRRWIGAEWAQYLLPVGASLGVGLLLFFLIFGVAALRGLRGVRPFSAFISFQSLIWMTAPLAWLYAVPYERFLSPADATAANLWTLAVVSAWRVALVTRFASVLLAVGAWRIIPLVMVVANAVAFFLIQLTPVPIIDVMGGIERTASEAVIANTALLTGFLAVITFPVFLIWAAVSAQRWQPRWVATGEGAPQHCRLGFSAVALALGSIMIGVASLLSTQPPHRLRYLVEERLTRGNLDGAIALFLSHDRDKFPRHWDPPPRLARGERSPQPIEVVERVMDDERLAWVRDLYAAKLAAMYSPYETFDDDAVRYLHVLSKLPQGPAIARELGTSLRERLGDQSLPPEQRDAIEAILKIAEEDGDSVVGFGADE